MSRSCASASQPLVADPWQSGHPVADPNQSPRLYAPNPTVIQVPVEQLLHAGFRMKAYEKPPRGASAQQKAAEEQGACVLDEKDHEFIMEELQQR